MSSDDSDHSSWVEVDQWASIGEDYGNLEDARAKLAEKLERDLKEVEERYKDQGGKESSACQLAQAEIYERYEEKDEKLDQWEQRIDAWGAFVAHHEQKSRASHQAGRAASPPRSQGSSSESDSLASPSSNFAKSEASFNPLLQQLLEEMAHAGEDSLMLSDHVLTSPGVAGCPNPTVGIPHVHVAAESSSTSEDESWVPRKLRAEHPVLIGGVPASKETGDPVHEIEIVLQGLSKTRARKVLSTVARSYQRIVVHHSALGSRSRPSNIQRTQVPRFEGSVNTVTEANRALSQLKKQMKCYRGKAPEELKRQYWSLMTRRRKLKGRC